MTMIYALLAQVAATAQGCQYDRPALMALDQDAFDQDMTGGWRKLEYDGCEAEAADLIRDWRVAHKAKGHVLVWHEGQLRADLGQTGVAISLFRQSYKPVKEDKGMGWNLYVDGTIAFLKGDRRAFDAAKARLAALPRPANFTMEGPDGKPVPVRWPLNMNVFEGLERCWGQPYKVAYACSTPMRRVTIPDTK
ncbi:hypothetical protein QLH51_04515 [Sphingomonas sp. 2R-10]|uniref:hypothetical protein n=1 Tax=Sphingomonas sp. 2R-10 TaxID=3045148 RepID=UPI0024BBC336|nr:hypothetical protein [Sphingomonas sp. 2R-10]MDJ0276067.1 hypothetical protein [Sphingomonas sp. 2R-10]